MKRTYLRRAGWILTVILAVAAVFCAFGLEPIGKLQTGTLLRLNGCMEELPEEKGVTQAFSYRIPEEAGTDLAFSFETYWEKIRILLDQEEIYTYEDPHKEKGVARHWVELPAEAQGKSLTIEFLEPSSKEMISNTMKSELYLGEKSALMWQLLTDNLYAALFAIVTFIMSLVIFIGNWCFRKGVSAKVRREFWNLGMFILTGGIWVLTDSKLLQLLTGRTGLVSMISYMSFMVMPYFLVSFIQAMLSRESRALDVLRVIYRINTVVYALFFIFRVHNGWILYIQHGAIIVTVIVMLKNFIAGIRKDKNKEILIIAYGTGAFLVCGCIALALFYGTPAYPYPYFYSIGLLIFMCCLMFSACSRGYYYMKQNAGMEVYREMAYKDALTGMGNRAAFMREQEDGTAREKAGYIMMDVNDLKYVNDNYGHQAGDQLLRDAAECIRESFEGLGKYFRIGGDEYVVITDGMTKEEIAERLAGMDERIKQKNTKRVVPLQIARGWAVQSGGQSEQMLMKEADACMYENKIKMKKEQGCS